MGTRQEDLRARIEQRKQLRSMIQRRMDARRGTDEQMEKLTDFSGAMSAEAPPRGPLAGSTTASQGRAPRESLLVRALGDIREGVPEVPRQVARGLSEVGHRTAIGTSELVGAKQTAANLRASRELSREVYGEPETVTGAIAQGATQLVGEGAQFMVPGVGAQRVLGGARGVQAARTAASAGTATRGQRVLSFLADPRGAGQRAAQNLVTGAPIDVAISMAGPEESMAGAGEALLGTDVAGRFLGEDRSERFSEALGGIARDPVQRGAFEVAGGFAAGQALGETIEGISRARGRGVRRDVHRELAEIQARRRAGPEPVTTIADPQQRIREASGRTVVREDPSVSRETPTGEPREPEVRAPEPEPTTTAPEPSRPSEGVPGVRAGEDAEVRIESEDPDFDTFDVGDRVFVDRIDEEAGMASVRFRHADGELGDQLFDIPLEAIGPAGRAGSKARSGSNLIVDEGVDQLDVQELRRLNQSSDVSSGKAKDVLSDAASRASQLREADGALRHFADTIPEDATLRSYLETKDGGDFLRRLVEDGVIAPGERARFIDVNTGAATSEGKQLVERMMYAAAIGDPDVIARAPGMILRKLDTALPAMIRADRVEGWGIGDVVAEALDLLASARAQGMELRDLVAQVDITREPPSGRVVNMARSLSERPKNSRGEVVGVKDAFRAYADDAEAFARQAESEDLFGFEPKGRETAEAEFAPLSVMDRMKRLVGGGREGQPFDELTAAERAAYSDRLMEKYRAQAEGSYELHFEADIDPVLRAKTPEELLDAAYNHPRAIEAAKSPQSGSGRDTWAIFGGKNPPPERQRLRDKWSAKIRDNAGWADPKEKLKVMGDGPVRQERRAVIILGPPAAGKSTVANPYVRSLGARLVDSDEFKKLIPEFDKGKAAGAVHEESSYLSALAYEEAIGRGDNLVRPTIGKSPEKVLDDIELLLSEGYEVHLVINELPAIEAAKRAWTRFLNQNRWVDPGYVINVGNKPSRSFDAVKNDPRLKSAWRYSNDVPKGTDPEILERIGEPPEGIRGPGRRGGEALPGSPRPDPEAEGVHLLSPPDDRNLFGEAYRVGPDQGAFDFGGGGPQGVTRALDEARTTVSTLEGRVLRGEASAADIRRYEEARAFVRRMEGQGLDAGEVSSRAREQGRAPEPDDTRDLFGMSPSAQAKPRSRLAASAQASERLPDAGPFSMKPEVSEGRLTSPTVVVRELGEALSRAMDGLGLKVATGKLPRGGKLMANALAVFKSRQQVVRQLNIADAPVFGHEAGHAMHKILMGHTPRGNLSDADLMVLPAAVRGELTDLGEGISGGGLTEGWAEFWRRYLDNPDALARQAPNALREIEQRLTAFPSVKEAWELARQDWTVYREAGPRARVRSKISVGDREPELLNVADRWSRFRTSVIDDMEPVRRIVQKIRDRVGLDGLQDEADTLARLTRGSVGVAQHFLEHGVLDFSTLKSRGPGLRQVLDPVLENVDAFREYMVARRAAELHDRDILTGFRNEDIRAVVRELEDEFGDTFKTAFDGIQEWNRGLLGYLRDAGVISRESFDAILELNQNYVPFYRSLPGGDKATGGFSETFGHLFSPVKRIKGSGEDVIDPIESLVRNAYTYTQIAQKQQVSQALGRLADKPGVGKVLEELGTPLRRVEFKLGEIEGKLEDMVPGLDGLLAKQRAKAKAEFDRLTRGMSEDEIAASGITMADPAEELLAVFRPGDYFGKPNMISVLEGGQRKWYEVDDELFAALEGLNKEQLDSFARWMGAPARSLRAGATLAPEFMIRNPLRDQAMAFVQSEYGYVPFVDMARGAFELIRKGESYQQWIASGGYRAALTSLDRRSMQNSVRQMVESGGVRNVIKHPFDALQALSSVMEDATRMGEFMNATKQLGTSKEALQRAAEASREISVDYARHGAKTAFLRHVSAFWNARLQGYDRLARAAKRNPAQFAAKAFGLITLPSLLEYYANMDDPDYWEQPQWKRDLFWMIKIPGMDDFISLPKPFELGLIFGTLPVRVLDSAIGGPGGGHEFRSFLKESLLAGEVGGVVPGVNALQPLVENAVNYSFFLGRPIVPRSEQEVRPRYQSGAYTSEVAQLLGRWAPGEGISPRKIDNVLYAWTGGLGRLGTQMTDPILQGRVPFTQGETPPIGRRFTDIPGIRGVTDAAPGFSSESVERFYELYTESRKATSTLRFLERSDQEQLYERELSDETQAELRSLQPMLADVAGRIAELRAEVEMIRRNPDMSSAEKRRMVDELGREAMEEARAALGRRLPGDGGL